MKKTLNFYIVIWLVLLAIFHVTAFVSVGWIGYEKYTPSFWIGYAFILISFIGQLACACHTLKEENARKLFYNISLLKTSYTGLIISFVIGGLCMLISPLPYWVGGILCAVVLGLNTIAVAKAAAAIDLVSAMDEKIKAQTFFIKSLTVDSESLLSRAKSEEAKRLCKKVYEAVRFSDPMSSDALEDLERKISAAFQKLSVAIGAEDQDAANSIAEEFLILIDERNKKCRMLK